MSDRGKCLGLPYTGDSPFKYGLNFHALLFHYVLFFFLLCRSDDDLDSEVEEVLYSQVHYASSLVISENSTLGMNVFLTCLSMYC